MTAVPGPTESAAWQTARWLARPIRFLEDNRRRYGDAFQVMFRGFKTPLVIVSHPDVLRALYGERGHRMPPGRQITLKPLVGARSLLLLEGDEHLSRRKVMLPPFRGDRMRAYEPIMREATERALASWPVGRAFSVHGSMQSITLDVILQAVFGVEDPARRARLHQLLGELLAATTSMSLQVQVLFGRTAPLERLHQMARDLNGLLLEEIAARRQAPGQDICSLLVQARFEDGSGMADEEIRDQLMTLLLAGHETTATGLAWALDLLVRHPDVLERARGGDEAYLRAVVSESLRLRPVVPLAGRRLAVPLEADGLSLPAGTDVTPAMWLTHTRAEEYPDPYAFRPERFESSPPSTYTWIPFGGGVRRCIGAPFAELEMRVVLAEVLARFDLRPAARGAEGIARRNVTFSPRHGTRVIASARVGG
ncbi:cytochrome P450 [Solirubrobacter sp. CPCC 204708]|uniref:Cytochrome P450 n=1 Tax=Solirubrobacter deserti TaxID=2282478 RepID=A0ABT4RLY6_9ACTN|nr:cytochrome P450 [Solirubrobacter deserti]MBE2314413.1 cytochrome P450 [Solirubrobacter deserti]MDA0139559.1 cytochrome P450 [Solirubrobacter deserti]